MNLKIRNPAYSLFSMFSIAMLLFTTPVFCEQEPVTTLRQLVKTISDSQPENPFIPFNSESMSSENIFSHIQTKMENQNIHVLDRKDMESPLSNLDFLNIVHAFSGGPKGNNLIDKKLYLKEKGFITSTDIGLATEVKGEATQYHKNSSYGKLVSLATPLFQFDQIRTTRKSRVAFTLDDKSRVVLSGVSNISIDKNIYNPEDRFRKMLFRVTKGTAHFIVSKAMKKGSTFAVITPNGIAGVRGTEFVTLVEPDGKTRFVVLEGKIETAPRLPGGRLGKRMFIGAGEMQTLYKNGRASQVQKAPKRLLDHLQKNSTIQDKIKEPKINRKASIPFKELEQSKRNSKIKTIANEKRKDAFKQIMASSTNAITQNIDRDTLKAFNNISNPSRLDQFKSKFQNRVRSQALDQIQQQATNHP